MHFCFVSTSRGSYFMTELLRAVSAATAAAGHSVELAFDEFPPLRDDCVYVVVPHEFRAWGAPQGFPGIQQRARTIALCTENLGTEWFEATYELVPEFAAAVSINRSSAAELRRRGMRCEHLQLGYAPMWDSWLRDRDVQRDIDVLYLGAADPRRDPLIAGLGPELWARNCQFLVPPLEPRTRPRPDFLKEADKYRRLRSAKVLLNLHRTTSSALEWMRFLEAICNGCVVVSEPCLDGEPLVAGRHFIESSAENIAQTVNELLDDPRRLEQMRDGAYDFIRGKLPMDQAGCRLADLAAELPRQPPGSQERPSRPRTAARPSPPAHAAVAADALRAPVGPSLAPSQAQPRSDAYKPLDRFRRVLRRARAHSSAIRTIHENAAYARAEPRVSVLGVLRPGHDSAGAEALASVAATQFSDLELLVLDDGSPDGGRRGAHRLLEEHPSLPAMLLRRSPALGLGEAHNRLLELARGEHLLILDMDGGVYPSTVGRLVKALDADPEATFAYPMVAGLAEGKPAALLSSLPWEPERLARASWIDALALVRRGRLIELGGYSTDPSIAGWEHFDLWCKCAEAGGYGVHVPQVLAWRAASTEAVPPEVWAVLRTRYPRLLGPPAGA